MSVSLSNVIVATEGIFMHLQRYSSKVITFLVKMTKRPIQEYSFSIVLSAKKV